MKSVKDVAKRAGVSTATVSRVINQSGYVSPELYQRVTQAIKELGYEANPFARGLKVDKSNTIGLIISTIENPFFATVVRGVESKVYNAGYSLILCNTDNKPELERMYIQLLRQKRVDGLIISASGGADEEIAALAEREMPIVLLNRRLREHRPCVDSVLSNSREGTRQAVAHLIDFGHQRIGIVSGPKDHLQGAERLVGYQQALTDAGLPVQPELIVEAPFTAEGGYSGTMALLERQPAPTALFVSNNLMTFGALQAVRELEYQIPDDLALVAFDDIEWAPFMAPPLSAVAQPAYDIGLTAAQRILDRLLGQLRGSSEESVLSTTLVIRESSGEPLNGGEG